MKATLAIITPSLLVALFAASCEKRQEGSTEKPPLVQGARLEKVAASAVDEYSEPTGTVRSKTTTVLSSKLMGAVIALHAHEGDRVREGQVLIEIDGRDARAHLDKAEAALRGKRPDEATIKQAAQFAAEAADPSADLRGSVEYKKDLVRVLTARALRKAIERAQKGA